MSSDLYVAMQPGLKPGSDPVATPEDAAAREQYDQFIKAWDNGHTAWVREAQKFDKFYQGDQWEKAVVEELAAAGRPTLTINLILSTLNVVFGEQDAARTDIVYKSRAGGHDTTADAISKYVHAVTEQNNFRWVASAVFADGMIQDRGYYDVRMDWTQSVEGKIAITSLDPCDVVLDTDAKESDPTTWKRVFTTRWVSLDDVAVEYGDDVAQKISSLVNTGNTYGAESIRSVAEDPTFGTDVKPRTSEGSYSGELQRSIRCIRIIEQQFKQSVRVHYLVDPATGQRRALPLTVKKAEAEKIAAAQKLFLQSMTEQRVRWRVTADRFVLHDAWSPYKSFTIVPFFPYFRRGRPFGMVRNLISPQEQYNKLSSQELHIVNTTANSGWIVEEGALVGMTPDELAQKGSKTGLVIVTAPNRRGGVDKIQPNTIPMGVTNISTKAANNVFAISGVNQAMLGTESPEVSGVALEKKTSVGQVQLAVPLSNFMKAQHGVARKLLELVRDFITFETTIAFANPQANDPAQRTGEVTLNQVQPDGKVANDVTVGEYDIVVSSAPDNDTYQEIQFAKMLNLRNVGVPIPGYRIVQASDLEGKDEIAEEMRSIEGLAPPSEEEMQAQAEAQALAMADAQAEVEKKAASARQADSTVVLNQAKAAELAAQPEIEMRKLETNYAVEQEGNKTRLAAESLKAVNRLDSQALGLFVKNEQAKQKQNSPKPNEA